MRGRFKDKIKLILIVLASVLAVILLVSIIAGRINTEEIIIVSKEGINPNVPLEQQLEYFSVKEISKKEFSIFGDSVVTKFEQLDNKKVNFNLDVGSPILLNSLSEPNSGGGFALSLEEGKTVHLFPMAAVGMPPMEQGDKINVGITYDDTDEFGNQDIKSSILFFDLEIANIIEGDVFVKVSLQQDIILTTSQSVGEFFFQLPGKSPLELCAEDSDPETVCLPADYLPVEASSSEILDLISNGQALNLSDRQLSTEILRLQKELDEAKKDNQDDIDGEEDEDSDSDNDSEDGNEESETDIPGTEFLEKEKLDLNSATAEKINEMTGINPVISKSIVEYRDENGDYDELDDLLNVDGVDKQTLLVFKEIVVFD